MKMNVVALYVTFILLFAGAVSVVAEENIWASLEPWTHQASDGVRRITPARLRQALRNNKAVLVDVRSEKAYRAGHIKGAINIPVEEIGNRIGELPKSKLIATYCA